MEFRLLSQARALAVGSDLWVIPTPAHSHWSTKIDWYINAMISRAENRIPQQISPDLEKILQAEELQLAPVSTPSAASLMIATAEWLPNKYTILVPYDGDTMKWTRLVHESWSQLGSPTLRVFLPAAARPDTFEKHWPEKTKGSIGLVEDSGVN